MKNKKAYRAKTKAEKKLDSQKFLLAVQKNKKKIHQALGNLIEIQDLYLSDIQALLSIKNDLDYLVEENVLKKNGGWEDLSWAEKGNTSGRYRYDEEVAQ